MKLHVNLREIRLQLKLVTPRPTLILHDAYIRMLYRSYWYRNGKCCRGFGYNNELVQDAN